MSLHFIEKEALIQNRCLVIGHSRALMGETREALALYARALNLANDAVSVVSTATTEAKESLPKLNIDLNELQGFHQYMDGLVSQYRALVELKNLLSQQKAAAKDVYRPPLAERLDEYPIEDVDLTHLVNYPPRLQPIPVKPLFFDLAWNYIDYPGRAPSVTNGTPTVPKAAEEEKKVPAKKGWFGFGR